MSQLSTSPLMSLVSHNQQMSWVQLVSWVSLGSRVPPCPGCSSISGADFVLGVVLDTGAFLLCCKCHGCVWCLGYHSFPCVLLVSVAALVLCVAGVSADTLAIGAAFGMSVMGLAGVFGATLSLCHSCLEWHGCRWYLRSCLSWVLLVTSGATLALGAL